MLTEEIGSEKNCFIHGCPSHSLFVSAVNMGEKRKVAPTGLYSPLSMPSKYVCTPDPHMIEG